jgi:hypothetical protein
VSVARSPQAKAAQIAGARLGGARAWREAAEMSSTILAGSGWCRAQLRRQSIELINQQLRGERAARKAA